MKKLQTELPLSEQAQEILSEESIQSIETAFSAKLELAVESALTKQDELYADRLRKLITALDKDHSKKLKYVVEHTDKSNAKKLKKVIDKYEATLNLEAAKFKKTLVASISDYLEECINEVIPKEAILEATRNKTAHQVLSNLRQALAVDSALMNESVKGAVVDGKNQINELTQQVADLTKKEQQLQEALEQKSAQLVLEQKCATLPDKKKEYIKKVMAGKTAKFIAENFEYTLRLHDNNEKARVELIREDAFNNRTVKSDAPKVLTEQNKNIGTGSYLPELQRYK